ncbi:APC family permease [Thalassospiraceae bacterium LMO-JJ14]|nr:APC family permease [Thalassospiraceae bacterium LMO-JJ14]
MAHNHVDRSARYAKNSLTMTGAVALGTGVMIGAGIFALTGQVAQMAGEWFPLAFIAAAVVVAFSAYSYVKLSNAFPSAGGIAMFLEKAYGPGTMTAACALLMYLSMVINESLVARTFGTYVMRLYDGTPPSWAVPTLGVGLLLFAFFVNILGNKMIQTLSFIMAFLKIGGIAVFAIAGLAASGMTFESVSVDPADTTVGGFLGAVALGILAYKGFTTITNSGGEIIDPHRSVGRAIIIAIAICVVIYVLVSLAVGANLSLAEIVSARDYALAEAAEPAFGDLGLWFTVAFAIVATVSGVIASVFAVSRMLAMLTEMKLVPHSHFGMPGDIQKHTLVYTIVIAMVLTVFFDLGRIAALGAIFYIIMDIAVHWGILRHLRIEIGASAWVLVTAIVLDVAVLAALLMIKAGSDMTLVYVATAGIVVVFFGERLFLKRRR